MRPGKLFLKVVVLYTTVAVGIIGVIIILILRPEILKEAIKILTSELAMKIMHKIRKRIKIS